MYIVIRYIKKCKASNNLILIFKKIQKTERIYKGYMDELEKTLKDFFAPFENNHISEEEAEKRRIKDLEEDVKYVESWTK